MSQLGVVDPALLAYRDGPMSIAESMNGGLPTREEWGDDEEELQENTKDVTGALVIKSKSEDREGSQVNEVKKRLTSEEVVYQLSKRKRESYFRSTSQRMRENMRKIGTVTGCYGVLYLSRHGLLFHPSTDYAGM